MFNALWLVVAFLIVMLLLFLLVDWYLKHGSQKKTDKTTATKEAPKPTVMQEKTNTETAPTATTTAPTMNIYNSNLADDLDAMLKNDKPQTTRQNRSDSTANKGRIADYIATKNYQTFSFDTAPETEPEPKMTVTKEDYKKFVALSNIDDKK